MNPSTESRSEPRFRKFEVKFEHPAKGKDRCGGCVHFRPTHDLCKIVRGIVYPQDWCDQFRAFEKDGPPLE